MEEKGRNLIKNYKIAFDTPNVWNDLLKKFDRKSYTMGGNALDMAYKEGRRDVILYIKKKIEAKLDD